MLVAGAAMSLIAPMAAHASETLDMYGMDNYSRSKNSTKRIDVNTFSDEIPEDIATLKGRVDGLGSQQNNLEAGAFSSTTSMDGKAVMWIGAIDGINEISSTTSETVQTGYTYTINLNTSFSGDDNLYVRLKGGENGSAWAVKPAGYHIETKDTSDAFKVDKIWYSFPVGDNITGFIGPRIENYYMYITPSIYKPGALKAFKLGGNSNFGASTDVGFGVKWETDGGFGIATNVVDKNADSSGFFGETSTSKWDTQIAYTQDRWHVSGTVSIADNWTSQQYNATAFGEDTVADSTGYALRAYWRPEESGTAVPEISVGYDTKSFLTPKTANTLSNIGQAKEADSYMIGLTWKDMFQADDRIGFAVTQPLNVTEVHGGGSFTEVDPLLWELYYSFKANDSMSITPAVFGGSDSWSDSDDDTFGTVVTTTFKF